MHNILNYSIYYAQTPGNLENPPSFQKKEFVFIKGIKINPNVSKKHNYFFQKIF
jgi:hypothetical protein